MITIKKAAEQQLDLLKSWWVAWKEEAPDFSITLNTAWVFSIDEKPVMALNMFHVKELKACFVENFISDPEFKKVPHQKELIMVFQNFLEDEAKKLGVQALVCVTKREKLAKSFAKLGYNLIDQGLILMKKDLG